MIWSRLSLHDQGERVDDSRVELGSAVVLELAKGLGGGVRSPVGAGRGDRVVGVAAGDDSGDERNILPCEAVGVAVAVVVFMARADDGSDLGKQSADAEKELFAFAAVGVDDGALSGRERAWL